MRSRRAGTHGRVEVAVVPMLRFARIVRIFGIFRCSEIVREIAMRLALLRVRA